MCSTGKLFYYILLSNYAKNNSEKLEWNNFLITDGLPILTTF